MNHVIRKRCLLKINTFYRNVSKKYKHTYSEALMHQNIDEAIDGMYEIEKTLLGGLLYSQDGQITTWQTSTSGILLILSTEISSRLWMPAMHKTSSNNNH